MREAFPSNYFCVCLSSLAASLHTTNGGDSLCVAHCPGAWGHSQCQGRTVTAWVADTAAPVLRTGLQDEPSWTEAACSSALGSPREATSTSPHSTWHKQQGQCRQPGKSWVAEEVFCSQPATSAFAPAFSLGDPQRCSFHFSAAGEGVCGGLRGTNDA